MERKYSAAALGYLVHCNKGVRYNFLHVVETKRYAEFLVCTYNDETKGNDQICYENRYKVIELLTRLFQV